MGYGRSADRFAGAMSRLLHLRGAKENTIGYLHQYLDLAPDQLFPVPKPITATRSPFFNCSSNRSNASQRRQPGSVFFRLPDMSMSKMTV